MDETFEKEKYGVVQYASREDWLAARKSRVTSTDLAAILGYTPWRTALDVWREKMDLLPPVEENAYMRAGARMERVIGEWYGETYGVEMLPLRHAVVLDADSPILASPDFFAHGAEDWPVEAKFTTIRATAEDLPPRFIVQVQALMACVPAFQRTALAVCLNGYEFSDTDVPRDNVTIVTLRQVAVEFADLVRRAEPPAPQTMGDLRVLYPQHRPGKVVTVGETIMASIAEAKQLKAAIEEAEARFKTLDYLIRETFRDAEEMVCGDILLATYRTAKPSLKFDEKRFAADHPDLYAKYRAEQAGSRRLYLK